MKVRILSGNALGQVVDMDRTEAEVNLATGFVELAPEAARPVVVEVKVDLGSRGRRREPRPDSEPAE